MTDVLAAVFLGISARTDIRTREVSVKFCILCGTIGIGVQMWLGRMEMIQLAAGAAVGMILLGIGFLSREAIGYGDGIAVAVLGIWLGFAENLQTVLLAFVLSGVAGGILILTKRKSGKDSIPFIPFLLAAHLLIMLSKIGK